MYCSKCGSEIKEDENFCSKCGKAISNDENINDNIKRKKLCLTRAILTVIIVSAMIVAISIIGKTFTNGTKYETIDLILESGTELKINKTKLDKGLASIKQELSDTNKIGIVYTNNDITEYLVAVCDNKSSGSYQIKTILDKNGSVLDGVYGLYKDNLIAPVYGSYEDGAFYQAGTFISNNYKVIIVSYNKNGSIEILKEQTNHIEENRRLSMIERAIGSGLIDIKYKDGITETNLKGLYDNGNLNLIYSDFEECISDVKQAKLLLPEITNIENGIYTDKKYIMESGNEPMSYSMIMISNGILEYNSEYTTYQGSYIIDNNKLIVTYNKAYDTENNQVELDILNDTFTLVSVNKFISSDGIVYNKESN